MGFDISSSSVIACRKKSVQPIYIIDLNRYSTQRELEALALISGMVKQRLDVDVTLFPKLIYLRSDFSDVHDLKERFTEIKKRLHLGTQYYWLAVIAENLKWGPVELSIENIRLHPVSFRKQYLTI